MMEFRGTVVYKLRTRERSRYPLAYAGPIVEDSMQVAAQRNAFVGSEFLSVETQDLQSLAQRLRQQYQQASPCPNFQYDGFFNPEALAAVLAEFPELDAADDIAYNTPNEIKRASAGERRFGRVSKAFVHFLNSEPFLDFLQALTGIQERLLPDPYLWGGGFHQTKPGGFLKVHADFNKHPATGLDRRLNLLVYLNQNWKEEYGGHFELWERDMTQCAKRVLPAFNTVALFTTTDFSYHGMPKPLSCPPARSRKSLALYYYSNGRPSHEINHGLESHTTLFKDRRGVLGDAQMRWFNRVQDAKQVLKDFVPPILLRNLKATTKLNAQ